MFEIQRMCNECGDRGLASNVRRLPPVSPRATSHALSLLAVLFTATAAAATQWVCVNPTAGQAAVCRWMSDVHSDGSLLVAVGEHGKLMTSTDGISWVDRRTGTEAQLLGVTGNGALWVSVGLGGTVLTSTDGGTWTLRDAGTTNALWDVTWSASLGLFVAVGGSTYSAEIHTSPDGVSWSRSFAASSYRLTGVACSATRCAAVGRAGAIQWSDDAITWTRTPPYAQAANINGVTTNGSLFVAVGQGSVYNDVYILTSLDGLTWTMQANGNKTLYDVCWGGGQFVAAGTAGVYTSPDGLDWTPRSTGSSTGLYGVTAHGSSFVTVGEVALLTSADGITWTDRLTGNARYRYQGLNAVASSGSQLIAVGHGGLFLTSADGLSWVEHPSFTSSHLYGMGFGSGAQVAVAVAAGWGRIFTSNDLSTWDQRSTGTTHDLHAVASSGALFVAVGDAGSIETSATGDFWTSAASPTSSDLNGVVWTGTAFVAVGDGGTVLTSANGTSWFEQDSGSTKDIHDVVWDGTRVIASTSSGNVGVSTDGASWVFSWVDQDLPSDTMFGIHAIKRQVVIAGSNGELLGANDANDEVWDHLESGTRALDFFDVGGNAASFLVVGEGGVILRWLPSVFVDGFESGSTSAWSLATQ